MNGPSLAGRVTLSLAAVVLVVSLVSGPVVEGPDLSPESRAPEGPGDGTAEASVLSDPAAGVVVEQGRFGTGVYYVRAPDAVVDVSRVEGRVRLVYRLRIPALGLERVATRSIDGPGRVRVHMSPRAYPTLANDTYRAHVEVRVQSFRTDETVYSRNTTVEAPTGPGTA